MDSEGTNKLAYMLIGATILATGFLAGLIFDRLVIWLWP